MLDGVVLGFDSMVRFLIRRGDECSFLRVPSRRPRVPKVRFRPPGDLNVTIQARGSCVLPFQTPIPGTGVQPLVRTVAVGEDIGFGSPPLSSLDMFAFFRSATSVRRGLESDYRTILGYQLQPGVGHPQIWSRATGARWVRIPPRGVVDKYAPSGPE